MLIGKTPYLVFVPRPWAASCSSNNLAWRTAEEVRLKPANLVLLFQRTFFGFAVGADGSGRGEVLIKVAATGFVGAGHLGADFAMSTDFWN